MRKRHLTLVFVLGVLCCVFSPGASAQAPDNCFATNTWGFPLAIPTGWAYYGGYPGTLTYVIWAWKGGCPSQVLETRCVYRASLRRPGNPSI
jgi:hypothetical protein